MISVITWDASFRESYHTVDFFNQQTLSKNKFEFIWVEFYSKINPELSKKIQGMGNGRTFCFEGEGRWHLGRCINRAMRECDGDLIVIPDGDIVVEADFLEEVARCHEKYQELVLYFRRWDEPRLDDKTTGIDIFRLKKSCVLTNPTNYGGCITLSKKIFNYVCGYEESSLFFEAGANGMELYTRLKNVGFPIMWHPTHKIYHPWHSGSSPQDENYLRKLSQQMSYIKNLDLNVAFRADSKVE